MIDPFPTAPNGVSEIDAGEPDGPDFRNANALNLAC
ncbi:MAG: hypothetical protein QOJ08_2300, partial [Ilumatobacteraceae bacterium]